MSDSISKKGTPTLVWVKAANPLAHSNGSAFVSLAFARVFAERFDLHLVCFSRGKDDGPVETTALAPFSSITLVTPSHQQSRTHRLVFGSYFKLLDLCAMRPLAESIDSCPAMKKAVKDKMVENGAQILVAEYWTTGSLIAAVPAKRSLLLLHDVEHENVRQFASEGTRLQKLRAALFSRLVHRRELHAARSSDQVIFISEEDRDAFASAGAPAGRFAPVPVAVQQAKQPLTTDRVLFLGGLGWHPNRDGLNWFLSEIWPDVRRLVPTAELIVVGGGEPIGPRSSDGVSYLGWVESVLEQLHLATVGVVPIRTGTGAKIKTIEMMASGLPLVATACGARGTAARHGGAIIADDANDFAAAVTSLLLSPEDRSKLREESIRATEKFHSTEVAGAIRDQLFDSVTEYSDDV